MKLTSSEYQSLISHLKTTPVTARFNGADRIGIQNLASSGYDLAALDEQRLRKLIAFLPHGALKKLHSPVLSKIQKKAKQTLMHRARPHLDPEFWPKVFRSINNNDRAGLRDFGGGQLGILNDRAMATPLRGRFVWNERKFGDLLIMGPWSDIASTLGDGSGVSFEFGYSDIYAGDVNVEFDRMYTEEKIPKDDRGFYVTHLGGCAFEVADSEGEVVLNPRGELVELAGGAATGLVGGGASFEGALEVIDVGKGVFETGLAMGENLGIKLKGGSGNRHMHTFVVSILPATKNTCVSTGKQSLSGRELYDHCKRLAGVS